MIKTKHISINLILDTDYWDFIPTFTLCINERSLEIGFLCFSIDISLENKSSLNKDKTFSEELLDININ